MDLNIIFLGSSGAIQVPSFNCTCEICEEARRNNKLRTRASAALIGKETVIIDASPDLPYQLEREGLRKIDRIFLTHWHFDHVWGLSELLEPSFISNWPPIEVYLPKQDVEYYQKVMGYVKEDKVNLHPVKPGDMIELSDATWEVVKTNHTENSVGYIVRKSKSLAYLLDSYVPPKETVDRLEGIDTLVLGATLDEYLFKKGEERWLHFSVPEAVKFWKEVGADTCILTHLTCHRYMNGYIVAGLSESDRLEYESKHPGLTFAYDGMRIQLI